MYSHKCLFCNLSVIQRMFQNSMLTQWHCDEFTGTGLFENVGLFINSVECRCICENLVPFQYYVPSSLSLGCLNAVCQNYSEFCGIEWRCCCLYNLFCLSFLIYVQDMHWGLTYFHLFPVCPSAEVNRQHKSGLHGWETTPGLVDCHMK